MFPLLLATVIVLFFSGYWLWKLINTFYFCDYVIITYTIVS